IRRLLDETDPQLDGFDGARVAVERDYNSQDFAPALEAFVDARRANVRMVAEATDREPAALERSGIFEGERRVTLLDVLEMMREHDGGHLREIAELRGAVRDAR